MKISARWPGQLSWMHGPAVNRRGTPAEFIGYVEAPDEEQAIKQAIKQFEISDPEKQKRGGAEGGVA
jgi:hypothetical protein